MLIRNLGAPRVIASPTHDHYSDEIDTGETVDVPDDLGVALCDQTDIWEPADADAQSTYDSAVRAREKAAVEADKAEHPDETVRERKARLKAEAEAALVAEQEVN